MTKKKEKIVKYLADGNIAKVGMIVKVTKTANGNDIGTITKIVQIKCTLHDYPIERQDFVICLALNSNTGFNSLDFSKKHPDIPVWEEWARYLVKATPEERKQYYAELYARNDQ